MGPLTTLTLMTCLIAQVRQDRVLITLPLTMGPHAALGLYITVVRQARIQGLLDFTEF